MGGAGSVERGTVSSSIVRLLLAAAAARGQDPAGLVARFSIDAAALADPDARVPARLGIRLWSELPALCQDDHFGLRLGESVPVGSLPVLGYILQTSATLGEGIEHVLRYQHILQSVNRAELARPAGNAGEARLRVHVQAEHAEPLRHAIDFALAFFVTLARRISQVPLAPRLARFAYRAPRDASHHRRLLAPELEFSAPFTELFFEPRALDAPLSTAEPELARVLARYAETLAARVPETSSLRAQARAALEETLPAGKSQLADLARRLHVGARTLQRRLAEEGTSHAALLDDVRKDLALRFVADPDRALAHVAFLLGFADQSTFHRAFLRWTGETPGAYRRRAR